MNVVAIDGVLGSGKTTVAKRVADQVGLEYLDTGAMYRCVALASLREHTNLEEAAAGPGASRDAVVSIARRALIEVGSDAAGEQVVRLDGNTVTSEIREANTARGASLVATIPEVRAELVSRQRSWALGRNGGVLEGRDIASVVFPDAATKVFLTASVEERAKRRHSEQSEKSYEEVLADLEWRDRNDATRAADPLKVADGATVVDTTGKSIDDVVREVAALVRANAAGENARVTSGNAPASNAQPFADAQSTGAAGHSNAPDGQATATDPAVVSDVSDAGTAVAKPDVKSDRKPDVKPAKDVALPSLEDLGRPMSRGQSFVFNTTRLIFVPAISWFFHATYEGLENVPAKGGFILAPTHRSNIDFSLLPRVSKRRMRFLGKDSIWKFKPLGSFFFALGGVPVRRGTTDRESFRVCSAVLDGGEGLVVFPEGTRKSGPNIEALFDGAAYLACKHGVPVIPVGIGGSEHSMPRGAKFPKRIQARVIIGKAIVPGGSGRKHTKALTDELGAELQRLFDEANS